MASACRREPCRGASRSQSGRCTCVASLNAAANVRLIDEAQAEYCVLRHRWPREWGCLVPGVPHQIVVEGEELATRSKLMRRAGF
jgi:hypothetical protein